MGDNRGGYRQAAPGTHTPNRRDLQTPGQRINAGNVPRGQPYGQAARQSRALAAVPTAGAGAVPTPSPSPTPTDPGTAIAPGDIPSLTDPTAFPDEPVTAGLSIGPGAGPEALGMVPQAPVELGVIRALYQKYGYDEFRQLIDWMENNG